MNPDDDYLPMHKREGYAEMMYEAADMRRKALMEDVLIEGRRLNYEAYIDGKREAESMNKDREP